MTCDRIRYPGVYLLVDDDKMEQTIAEYRTLSPYELIVEGWRMQCGFLGYTAADVAALYTVRSLPARQLLAKITDCMSRFWAFVHVQQGACIPAVRMLMVPEENARKYYIPEAGETADPDHMPIADNEYHHA